MVWLQVTPAVAAARLGVAGAATRPMLDGPEQVSDRLTALEQERRRVYEKAADLEIDTAARLPEEVAGEIHRALVARGSEWGFSAS